MPQDHDAIRTVIVGLVVALVLLVFNLAGTLWLYWADDARPSDLIDVAGAATIGTAILAIVATLGAYLSREQKKDD